MDSEKESKESILSLHFDDDDDDDDEVFLTYLILMSIFVCLIFLQFFFYNYVFLRFQDFQINIDIFCKQL